jgi:hypothetical protein
MVRFHGGCSGCTNQEDKGIEYCCNCQYFEADWNKPDLNPNSGDPKDIIRAEIKDRKERRVKHRLQDRIKHRIKLWG